MKSLICKAAASLLNLPLIRIDIGKVMQSYVGSSEANMRKVIAVVESSQPVVCWLDEIDKSMSGVQSSTFSDSGTLSRVFGTFLTWAQERKGMVFIMATCNAMIHSSGQLLLPPELTRAGRFDAIYWVDQPSTKEAADIFRIHISKPRMEHSGRDPKKYDIDKLSKIRYTDSDGKKYSYTGAEIEAAVKEAMYNAYYEKREYTTEDIEHALKSATPITYTMKDALNALRNYGKNKFRPASYPEISDIAAIPTTSNKKLLEKVSI